jgi:hypothetical protein
MVACHLFVLFSSLVRSSSDLAKNCPLIVVNVGYNELSADASVTVLAVGFIISRDEFVLLGLSMVYLMI